MLISDITLKASIEGCEVSATVTFENSPRETDRLWFRTGPDTPVPAVSGNSFLAAFFVPAMYLGEDLHIETEVDEELVQSVQNRIAPILLRWYPGFRTPKISTGGAGFDSSPHGPGSGIACTFSTGVDSWYTLIKHRQEVTHLLFCEGFDRSNPSPTFYPMHFDKIRKIAAQWKKQPVFLKSNLTNIAVDRVQARQIGARGPFVTSFQTDCYFGGQLAAYANLFPHVFRKLYIASSNPYEILQGVSSNPLIDPAWSSRNIEIVHDGAEADRTEKVRYILQHEPTALDTIGVCHNLHSDGRNCGRCEKCIRTMIAFRLAGVADHHPFENPLEPKTIRGLAIVGPQIDHWNDLHEQAAIRGDEEIRALVEIALGRRIHAGQVGAEFRVFRRDIRTKVGRRKMRKRIKNWIREKRSDALRSL